MKAYISWKLGSDDELKTPEIRHDLDALWRLASQHGLIIRIPPREWVTTLSGLHNPPYFLRYAPGVNGIVSPGVEPMTTELGQLVSDIGAVVRG